MMLFQMNKDQFHKRLKEILSVNRGPNNSPDEQFHDVMHNEVLGRSKKGWDENIAAQVIREFEWATGTQPKSIELPEDEIKSLFKKFLIVRCRYCLALIYMYGFR